MPEVTAADGAPAWWPWSGSPGDGAAAGAGLAALCDRGMAGPVAARAVARLGAR
jgi:hypothetical protein